MKMKNSMPDIIKFDKSAELKLLSFFSKDVDTERFVVEKGTNDRVLSFDGSEIQIDKFGGIMIGSEIFIKSDIDSIIKFIELSDA